MNELPAPPSRPPGWTLAGSLLAVVALNVVRCPQLLARPRFWAEEGQDYFALAFRDGFWASLVAPHLGYFALVPNLAAGLAALVPLELAPAVTTWIALGVQLAVSALALTVRAPQWATPAMRFAVAVAIPLLAPMEVWLTTIAAQFWLAIAAFLVLHDEASEGGRLRRWVLRGTLAAAGLTGVASCFLAPFFLWQAARTRDAEDRVRAAILVGAAFVQVLVLAIAASGAETSLAERFATSELSPLWLAIEHLAVPFAGLEPLASGWLRGPDRWFFELLVATFGAGAEGWPRFALLVVLLAAGGLVAAHAVAGVRSRDERPGWLAWISFIALATATSIHFAGSPRYAFAPNVFLAALLIAQLDRRARAWRRWTAAALLAAGLISNLAYFRARVYYSPDLPRWSDEVARWRADPSYAPRIWPQFPVKSWRVELSRAE